MQLVTSLIVIAAYIAVGYIIGLICGDGHADNITLGTLLLWPLILGGYIIYVISAMFIILVKWIRGAWNR